MISTCKAKCKQYNYNRDLLYRSKSLKKIYTKIKSSIKYLKIFIFKKNKKIKYYINYRKLNDIIIKN